MRQKQIPARQSRQGHGSRQNIQPDNNEKLTDTDDDNLDVASQPPRKPEKKNNITNELRETQFYLKDNNPIRKLPFGSLITEILLAVCPRDFRVSRVALEALQEASEFYFVQIFEDACRCILLRKRVTLQPNDIQVARCWREVLNDLYQFYLYP